MFQSIMVPLDGSPLAERALDLAMPIVRASAARLHLTTVLRSASDDPGRDVERLYLNRMADRLAVRLGTTVTRAALVDRFVGRVITDPPRRAIADVLDDYIRDADIDLTVMTTHGRGGLTRLYMGSVADSFIRYSPSPVLVLRPHGEPVTLARILVPLDGTAASAVIVPHAISLALAAGGSCTLLRVLAPREDAGDALDFLKDKRAQFEAAGVSVDTVVQVSDDAAASILVYTIANGIDVIAMTTRTRDPLRRVVFGSVADRLIRKAGKPVLICNPFFQNARQRVAAEAVVEWGE